MYEQFCKNIIHFLEINNEENYRSKLARELLVLSDVKKYKKWEEENSSKYIEASFLVYNLGMYKEMYPSLKNFSYELWAYGFDSLKLQDGHRADEMYEKAKLVDLLLSTHYWY